MMFKFKTFVGIDISKQTFDAALVTKNRAGIHHQCFSQNKDGFTAFLQWPVPDIETGEVRGTFTILTRSANDIYEADTQRRA